MLQRKFFRKIVGSVALGVAVMCGVAHAQPVADRVPADAIVYFGFSGTDAMPGYSGTHAEALLNASSLPQVFRQVLPAGIKKLAQREPEGAAHAQQAYDSLAILTRKPTAFFISGLKFEEGRDEPTPRLGLICRAGAADAEKIRVQVQALIDKATAEGDLDEDLPVKVVTSGDDVAWLIGYAPDEMALAGGDGAARPNAIGAATAFAAAMKQVQADPAVCFYFDGEKTFELIDSIVQREADEQEKAQYESVVNALGLRGLKQLVVTGGFDGQDWMTRSFLAAPSPRTGLLANLDNPPLTDELLKAVPANADLFAAGSFDVAKFITELRASLGKIDPEIQKQFDQGLGAATMALGVNFQTGVLEPLGSQWLTYIAPQVAGGGLTGLVAINRVDDPAKARSGLMAVSIFANNTSNTFLANKGVTVQGRQFKAGDLSINYVAAPLVTPSWAISGNYAMFGLYPQALIDANAHLAGGGKSILDNPDYQKLRQRLGGPAQVSGVYFANLPQTAAPAYQGLLVISRVVGIADLFGVQTPPVVIPPYSVFQQHLAPAGGIKWVDDAGVHGKAVSPFPGSGVFQGGGGVMPAMIAQSAASTGILLPSLSRSRETANRVRCSSNMRQIGVAAHMYAADNGGRFPDDLGTLASAQDLAPEVFVCPSSHDSDAQVRAMRQQGENLAAWLNENGGYVWAGAGKTNQMGAEAILMYERPEHHDFDGINVLFVDGHTEYMRRDQAERAIPDLNFRRR